MKHQIKSVNIHQSLTVYILKYETNESLEWHMVVAYADVFRLPNFRTYWNLELCQNMESSEVRELGLQFWKAIFFIDFWVLQEKIARNVLEGTPGTHLCEKFWVLRWTVYLTSARCYYG